MTPIHARTLLILAALALLVSPASAYTVTTSQSFQLAGEVYDAEHDERVMVTGSVHVVTRMHFDEKPVPGRANEPSSLDVHANLNNTSGVGLASGASYRGVGSEKGKIVPCMVPGGIEASAGFDYELHRKLREKGGIQPVPFLPVDLWLDFDERGELTGGRAEIPRDDGALR